MKGKKGARCLEVSKQGSDNRITVKGKSGYAHQLNREQAKRLGIASIDMLGHVHVTKERLWYRRISRPSTTEWGHPLPFVVIGRGQGRNHNRYWVSFGPDQTLYVCSFIEKLLGIRLKPGDVRLYEVEARSP